jgi:hypothetical protein
VPVVAPQTPLVKAISTILTNPRLAKSSFSFVLTVLDAITNDLFSNTCLEIIVSGLVSLAPSLDSDSAFNLLDHASTSLLAHFPHLNLIQAYFSMLLAMMTHSNVIISSSAFAKFPKVLEDLVSEVLKAKNCRMEIPEKLRKQFESLLVYKSEPAFFILYLLFTDLCAIGLHSAVSWLMVKTPPVSVVFDVLELILNSHAALLRERTELLEIFEGAVIQAMPDPNALQFVIAFIDGFLETHGSLCSSVFSDYMSRISAKNRSNVVPLTFFRCVAVRSQTLASRIYLGGGSEMLKGLVRALLDLSEPNAPSHPLTFSLAKGASITDLTCPYEICFGLLRGMGQMDGQEMSGFLTSLAPPLLKMILYGLRFASDKSFDVPAGALTDLLRILDHNHLAREFSICFTACTKLFGGRPDKYRDFLCKMSNEEA